MIRDPAIGAVICPTPFKVNASPDKDDAYLKKKPVKIDMD